MVEQPTGTLSKAINAGKWSFFGLVTQKVLSLGTFFILARLLTPKDYGIITVVLMFVGVLTTLSMPGFEKAMIQKKDDIDQYVDVFWTFNFLRSCGLALIIFLLTPWVAGFFQITDATSILVLRLSGLLSVIQAASNMGSLFFVRGLDYKRVFYCDVTGQIAFLVAALPWAYFRPSVVALFAGYLAQYSTITILQYILHSHRPHFSYYFKRLKDLTHYGKWVMAQNVLTQANSIVESTVVGRILGTRDLGLYSRANSIASLPSSTIVQLVYKIGFPAYARIQDSIQKVTQGFIKSLDIALSLTLPFLFLIIFAGGPLVSILLGSKWIDMTLTMKILVVSLTLEGLSTIIYPILEGVGKVDVRFKILFLQIILTLPLMVFFANIYGIAGAAFGITLASFIVFLVTAYWAFQNLPLKISDLAVPIFIIGSSLLITFLAALPFYSAALAMGNILFLVFLGLVGLLYLGIIAAIGSRFSTGPYQTFMTIYKTIW